MEQISTVRDLIDLWPSRRQLAADVGATEARVHKWAQTGSIPPKYHLSLVEAGRARGLPVSADLVVRIHAPRPAAEGEVLAPDSRGAA